MQTNAHNNVERQIAEHYGDSAAQAPLTSGFWPRLRARLDVPNKQRFAWLHALAGRRLLVASAASISVLAVLGVVTIPGLNESDSPGAFRPLSAGDSEDGGFFSFLSRSNRESQHSSSVEVADASSAAGYGLSVEGQGFDEIRDRFSADFAGDGASPNLTESPSPSPATIPRATPTPAPRAAASPSGGVEGALAQQIENAGRSVISTSGLAIEVESVPAALDRARTIAAAAGGFIQSMSTTGGADPDRGSVTIRVPGPQFTSALAQVKEIGTVTGEQVTSDDVTDQVIDLEARLRSEQAKEASFIELLEQADTVSDILAVERELSRVRTEIERLQGQLGFLEHRVDFSTINVNFGKPASLNNAAPPSASFAVRTREVEDGVAQVKEIVDQVSGVVDNTSISLRNDGLHGFVAVRVPPAEFDQVLFRLSQLGTVHAKEVRQPGTAEDAEPSEEAVAKIDVTFTEPQPLDYNWWLLIGAPLGGVVALALIVWLAVAINRRRASAA